MPALAGKVVWVTGAGSGIGRAVALAFAAEGARVALTGRSRATLAETEALAREGGGETLTVPADVTNEGDVAAAHRAVVAGLGDPDILVNNAGSNIVRRHWRDLAADGVAQVVDTNLKGPFLCTLAVLPAMRRRKDGLLIHIASFAATGIHFVSGPAYTAAKHGARAMSATINAEEGIHGIRSVCINPGEVATSILDKRPAPPSAAERAIMVQPEDVAAAAVFAALLPPRSCMAEMTIVPTDNHAYRDQARRIVEMAAHH